MIIQHQNFTILDKIVLERVVFKPPLRAKTVMHDEACFLYALNGHAKAYGGSEHHPLHPGEGLLVKCGSFLNNWRACHEDRPYEAYVIHFYPDVIKQVYRDEVPAFLTPKDKDQGVLIQKIEASEVLNNYIQGLIFYFENPALANDDIISLKLKELIALLYQMNSHSVRSILRDLFTPTTIVFKEVIEKNLFEDLSIEELAELTNLSLSSFKRKFKACFNDTPARYIKTKRLHKAADLLKISTHRITDICFDCGFNDVGHFSKSFIAFYGKSPSQFRKDYLDQIHQ